MREEENIETESGTDSKREKKEQREEREKEKRKRGKDRNRGKIAFLGFFDKKISLLKSCHF